MLFRNECLKGIQNGTVILAFRRWKRPTVLYGCTLLKPVGELSIGSVKGVALFSIAVTDTRLAGCESWEELPAELTLREEGEIEHIELGSLHLAPSSPRLPIP